MAKLLDGTTRMIGGRPMNPHLLMAEHAGVLLDSRHAIGIGSSAVSAAFRSGAMDVIAPPALSVHDETTLDIIMDEMAAQGGEKDMTTVTIPDVIPDHFLEQEHTLGARVLALT